MNWEAFFTNHGVPFVGGSRNQLMVSCPFCGSDDPSYHMSVNVEGKGWRCFRQPDQHKGISPVALVAALLKVSNLEARRLCGVNDRYLPEDFLSQVEANLLPKEEPPERTLRYPPSFRPLKKTFPAALRYRDYLVRRGFAEKDLTWLADQFDLRYAIQGAFHHRIIFPIRYRNKLMSWTGRAISPSMDLRYLSLPTDPDTAARMGLLPALEPITRHILWYDELMNFRRPNTIYLVEGPFDALKVWYLGQQYGIVATCFFTATASSTQISELHEVLPRFKRKFLLLDKGTLPTALRLESILAGLGVEVRQLPEGIKDPGMLTSVELLR